MSLHLSQPVCLDSMRKNEPPLSDSRREWLLSFQKKTSSPHTILDYPQRSRPGCPFIRCIRVIPTTFVIDAPKAPFRPSPRPGQRGRLAETTPAPPPAPSQRHVPSS